MNQALSRWIAPPLGAKYKACGATGGSRAVIRWPPLSVRPAGAPSRRTDSPSGRAASSVMRPPLLFFKGLIPSILGEVCRAVQAGRIGEWATGA